MSWHASWRQHLELPKPLVVFRVPKFNDLSDSSQKQWWILYIQTQDLWAIYTIRVVGRPTSTLKGQLTTQILAALCTSLSLSLHLIHCQALSWPITECDFGNAEKGHLSDSTWRVCLKQFTQPFNSLFFMPPQKCVWQYFHFKWQNEHSIMSFCLDP